MIGYFGRQVAKMLAFVFLATVVIYAMVYLIAGEIPVFKGQGRGDPRTMAEYLRIKAHFGLDKSLGGRYWVWLVGDDWLGAEWMYLGWRLPESGRFYAAPGFAYAKPGYPVWIEGDLTEGAAGRYEMVPRRIWLRPSGDPASGLFSGNLLTVTRNMLTVDLMGIYSDTLVVPDEATEWIVNDPPERPTGDGWVPVGWLFGPQGLLGEYAHFHGERRGVIRWDFGLSWTIATGLPVSDLIVSRLGNTALLIGTAVLLALLTAFSLGIFGALRPHSKPAGIIKIFGSLGAAMPVFWLALLAVSVFNSLKIMHYAPQNPGDWISQLGLTALILSFSYAAVWSSLIGRTLREELASDYILAARAAGLSRRTVILHALRNVMKPILLTLLGQIPGFFSSAILVETIFPWNGVGWLFYLAVYSTDVPVLMALLLIGAGVVAVCGLMSDMLRFDGRPVKEPRPARGVFPYQAT